MHRALTATVLGALAAGGAWPADDAPTLPYRLGIEVRYGSQGGPRNLRDELGRALVDGVIATGRFREVALEPHEGEPPDLLLRVTLEELREETIYHTTMDEQLRRDDPLTREKYEARFQTNVVVQLAVLPGREVVRSARFREYVSRAPRFVGEDAAAGVRVEAMADLVRGVRKSVLKGSADKLRRRIARARGATSGEPQR